MHTDITLAKRMSAIQPSFIRDILKAADDSEVISFAGGLPNRDYFPNDALAELTTRLMRDNPEQMLTP
jgi:2-aminoadipate transaminase